MSRHLDKAEEAAAAWDARLRGAKATFRHRRAFQAWLGQASDNRAAYDRLQAALSTLRANAELAELSALRDEARNSVDDIRRRRFATALSVAVAAALLMVLIIVPQTRQGAELAAVLQGGTIYSTSSDERTKVTMADGSMVTLDAGTRLVARLNASRRDITLLAGRALFQVAKDKRRPFIVRAGDRTITALGTVFDVRVAPGELRVTLAEGSVAVRPVRPSRGSPPQILKPHQQFVEVAGSPGTELRTVDTDRALSWVGGQVFFDDERLASAVEEMNQNSPRKIVVDPAIADLRINGMFRTTNQPGFLEALQLTLPVEVREDGHGRMLIVRRSGGDAH